MEPHGFIFNRMTRAKKKREKKISKLQNIRLIMVSFVPLFIYIPLDETDLKFTKINGITEINLY